MDQGLGPPQQSPDDYSARERRERTGVAVGISLGVIILFAGPLCLLYFANWRRRRRNKKLGLGDLEGTTAVSHSEKNGTTWFEHTAVSTLTTTVLTPEDALPTEAEIEEWRALQRGRKKTGPEGLKRAPTATLDSSCSTSKAIQPFTPNEILGLDKASYLRNLPVTGGPSSTTGGPPTITVVPSQVPTIAKPEFASKSSNKGRKVSDSDECVSPWVVEHEPNPVIFKHLLGPKDEVFGNGSSAYEPQDREISFYESRPNNMMDIDEENQRSQELEHNADGPNLTSERENSKESSSSEDASTSSPSASNNSQDSSDPLMSPKQLERDSQSPTSFRVPDVYQQLALASGSEQQTAQVPGNTTCSRCSRDFKTTGQLNAHIHRKHVRRYSCSICPSSFHLKTDLKRHKLTVHRKELPIEARGFRCPNQGCSIPEKTFLRRDNFDRHVARCVRRTESEHPRTMSD